MAKQDQGINGAYRGTVGTVIGYQWRGQWCLRAKPREVANPRTEAQQRNRQLFVEKVRFASAMKEVLAVGMRTASLEAHKTEANYFLRLNRQCFSMGHTGMEVVFGSLVVGVGPVAPVGFGQPSVEPGRTVVVPFEKNPLHRHTMPEDHVYLFAFCPDMGCGMLASPALRRDERVAAVLPEEWLGCTVHLYGLVRDADGNSSDSFYLDAVTVPHDEAPAGDAAEASADDSVAVAEDVAESHASEPVGTVEEREDVAPEDVGSGGEVAPEDVGSPGDVIPEVADVDRNPEAEVPRTVENKRSDTAGGQDGMMHPAAASEPSPDVQQMALFFPD